MSRWFNTAGPCNADDHYMLPPLRRLPDVRRLVDQKAYFVVHGPRQAGKTTSLMALARALTDEGRYAAVLVSMLLGAARPVRRPEDKDELIAAMLGTWRRTSELHLPPELRPPPWPEAPADERIGAALSAWAAVCPRPLVVFLDEFDALTDDMLRSAMRQLQEGYRDRPARFPWSVGLVGLRDVRDYRTGNDEPGTPGTPSPFNIIVRSLTLRDFSSEEVGELYEQHTAQTGQRFEPAAVARAFSLSRGQPWLANALASVAVDDLAPDRAAVITAADIDRAKEILISRRHVHLDSLADRLMDPRLRGVIEPMLQGADLDMIPPDDLRFATDLGLVEVGPEGGAEIANPIYREIVARELSYLPRGALPRIPASWLRADGHIDFEALLEAFLSFWRRHGEPLLRTAPYHEAAPHLVLMAFLDRVANGGGTLEREYAIGRGRMDLCLRHRGDTLGIEIKVWREARPDPAPEGLRQLDGYLAGLGDAPGWLVIFDRRSRAAPLEERLSMEKVMTPGGRKVVVIRA